MGGGWVRVWVRAERISCSPKAVKNILIRGCSISCNSCRQKSFNLLPYVLSCVSRVYISRTECYSALTVYVGKQLVYMHWLGLLQKRRVFLMPLSSKQGCTVKSFDAEDATDPQRPAVLRQEYHLRG